MFVRVKEVRTNGTKYRYLHIVENYRDGDRVRQRIVGSLGRLDELAASGDLEQVIRQLVDHCPAVRILRAEAAGTLQVERDRSWGPVLIFERLWEELGLRDLIRDMAKRRNFDFDMERMAFAQVFQRLVAPGSDLAGSKWIKTVEAEGFNDLQLMHFYKSLTFLWKRKNEIEQALFRRGLDLFNQKVDLVFFDTTSTYFEGTSLEGWAKLGKSKDHRPDHLQLVIGVVMRADGFPVACEIWPGNMADVKTIKPIVEGLKGRFGIRDVVLVCDRGMVSKANLQLIRDEGYHYIVGVKMRGVAEVRDEVIGAAGRYHLVNDNLRVKEVHVEDRRYVVCFNPEEAAKDRHDREGLIAKLEEKLKKGGVGSLINNRGYRRFLKVTKGSASIDRKKAQDDARYDGRYVLRTTTDLPAEEVALAYKQLTWIERLWRELKDVMEVRPIYHHWKRDNVKGHIFVCFLSLYLAALLRRRIAEAGDKFQWDEIIRDLSEVRAVIVQLDGQRYRLRSPVKGCAGAVFQAVGVKLPALAEPAP
jgi:Transposase DDE domain